MPFPKLSTAPREEQRPVRVLFVCLGNICRSPSAEGVFRHYVTEQGAAEDYEIDSAGLIAVHEGELPDGRMRAHAARRGYTLDSRSRPISYEDFFHYDYIIGMDEQNRERLLALAPSCRRRSPCCPSGRSAPPATTCPTPTTAAPRASSTSWTSSRPSCPTSTAIPTAASYPPRSC